LSTTIPAHELMANSQVVVALNSTTVVEAAVAGCQVVVPYFGPLRERKYDDRVFFQKDMALFNVPNDVDEFGEMLLESFDAPTVAEEIMVGRMSLFEKYVTQLDGLATERHISLFYELSGNQRAVGEAGM
jgi:hypothetical protein